MIVKRTPKRTPSFRDVFSLRVYYKERKMQENISENIDFMIVLHPKRTPEKSDNEESFTPNFKKLNHVLYQFYRLEFCFFAHEKLRKNCYSLAADHKYFNRYSLFCTKKEHQKRATMRRVLPLISKSSTMYYVPSNI